MRRVLAGFVVLMAASWVSVGCSSGGGGGGSGGSSASGSGGGNGNGNGGATGNGGTSGDCTLPVLWRDDSPNQDCTVCMQKNCCAVINTCASNPDCKAIYQCQSSCYDGKAPDGAVLPEDDAGAPDADDTPRDLCAMDCVKAASAAAQAVFVPMDECVNGQLPNQCGDPAVCY